MSEKPAVEKSVTLTNKTPNVVVSGAIRIMPGESLVLPESKLSESLRRLVGKTLAQE